MPSLSCLLFLLMQPVLLLVGLFAGGFPVFSVLLGFLLSDSPPSFQHAPPVQNDFVITDFSGRSIVSARGEAAVMLAQAEATAASAARLSALQGASEQLSNSVSDVFLSLLPFAFAFVGGGGAGEGTGIGASGAIAACFTLIAKRIVDTFSKALHPSPPERSSLLAALSHLAFSKNADSVDSVIPNMHSPAMVPFAILQ